MRWALTHSTNQFQYWKLEQDELSAELKYNNQAQSFRLTAGDKRLFFIEKTGFLQNKFLIRTEYSVVAGTILPTKNRHSGIIIFENKKYNYFLKENLLALSSKKENPSMAIEIADAATMGKSEFYALLFGTLRASVRVNKAKPEHVPA
jgi:hypothetical protein